jgi:hypothetical protein
MSQTPILTAHAFFHSHLVNCNICKKSVTEKGRGVWNVSTKAAEQHRLCPVGVILLANAIKEDPNANPFKPQSFPFVAKLYERILALVENVWQEARVIDRSISAAHQYEKLDEETGLLHWRTAAPQVIGYEVEAKGKRYYVNRHNIKKLQSSSAVERGKPSLNLPVAVGTEKHSRIKLKHHLSP